MEDYRAAGLAVRLEQRLRLSICPFEEVARMAPARGAIVDLGSGFGALAHLMALQSDERQVTGIEKQTHRVEVARRAGASRPNLSFVGGDVHDVAFGRVDCIVMNDFLHHVPHARQIPLLQKCHQSLNHGGLLLIKDVNKSSAAKYLWNYVHDALRNGNLPFFCLDTPVLVALLELVGFAVTVTPLDLGYPYSHVLYVCTKE